MSDDPNPSKKWYLPFGPRGTVIAGVIVTIVLGAVFFAIESGSMASGVAIFLALTITAGIGAGIFRLAMSAEQARTDAHAERSADAPAAQDEPPAE